MTLPILTWHTNRQRIEEMIANTLQVPCNATVDKDRKGVVITCAGEPIFAIVKECYIPHKFTVDTLHLGVMFQAQSLVLPANKSGAPNIAKFQFSMYNKDGSMVMGDICKSQTAALDNIALKTQLPKYRKGTNGKLHFGVMCDGIQALIRAHFQLPKLESTDNKVKKDKKPKTRSAEQLENVKRIQAQEEELFPELDLAFLENLDFIVAPNEDSDEVKDPMFVFVDYDDK